MAYSRMVEIGRVVYIAKGEDEGKLATIVEVLDGSRALVDGPCSGVKRKVENFNNLQLTKFILNVRHGARTKTVIKAWKESETGKKWAATSWAQKLHKRQLRSTMTDFDRFKLMKAKQMRNRIVKSEMKKIKKAKK